MDFNIISNNSFFLTVSDSKSAGWSFPYKSHFKVGVLGRQNKTVAWNTFNPYYLVLDSITQC